MCEPIFNVSSLTFHDTKECDTIPVHARVMNWTKILIIKVSWESPRPAGMQTKGLPPFSGQDLKEELGYSQWEQRSWPKLQTNHWGFGVYKGKCLFSRDYPQWHSNRRERRSSSYCLPLFLTASATQWWGDELQNEHLESNIHWHTALPCLD